MFIRKQPPSPKKKETENVYATIAIDDSATIHVAE